MFHIGYYFKKENREDEPLGRTLGRLLRTRFDGRSARARDKTYGVARAAGLEDS